MATTAAATAEPWARIEALSKARLPYDPPRRTASRC
jgi:hypothetical protein